ncbi:hypothetical protein [Massilibacteroides vaginae]|uniref:hypothetical protein n=1 Tax=Massilibacteroides vaginae TaxID=1673718 RepID=UPI000A1CB18A|nr:hypothetical protein [Massilibacteroides vaginae]
MRRRVTTFLILLPLALLTSLPCSIKQDLKQLLGISVNTSAQIEKSKVSNSICAYTSFQKKKSNKQQQLNIKQKQSVAHFLIQPLVPTGSLLYQSSGSDPGTSSTIPLFLAYRKLII